MGEEKEITLDVINEIRYYLWCSMIKSFSDAETKKIFHRIFSRKLPTNIQRVALRKLLMIHAAIHIEDLKIPPANRLEKLQDNRKNQYSIRINKQWRICFVWHDGDAHDVQVTDYH